MRPSDAHRPPLAVIGTGRIGLPVLAALVRAGFSVRAFDVCPQVRPHVEATGAEWADSAASAVAGTHVLLTVLPGSPELTALMLGGPGDGLLGELPDGATWIDLTSAAPDAGRELAAAAGARRIGYLDAPVGGGVDAARRSRLTLYVGGDAALLDRMRPLLAGIAEPTDIHHMGGSGAGYLTKLLVNLLWFDQAVATAEAFLLARRAGLDLDRLRGAILTGAAASEFVRTELPSVLAGDYREVFGLDRCVEELDAIERNARAHRVPFELSALVARLHRDALRHFGPVDGELLAMAYLEHRAGVRLRDDAP
jgi:3-hydroxyisobutyrate dehydrogenase